ncbi:MAG TPA: hypothetical protein V6C86_06410 [Oculatellaceae cyanobacterium]
MIFWLQFVLCAALIFFAGGRLSSCSDLIADKSGLSKNWVGLVLLAVTASSSQLVASITAVTCHDLPDLAVGGLMGSCMFNMLVIGLLDLFSAKKPVSNVVHRGHILSVGFGIVLLGFAAIDILFGKHLPVVQAMHRMDPITLAFVPIYLIAMRLTFLFEAARIQEDERTRSEHAGQQASSWYKLITIFVICASTILAASSYLPYLAEQIQAQTGWSQSFIGLSFIAIITCLPEVAVSTSAARRGSFDVAVASLLGSNLCYMVILAITDFFYIKEPLLRHVSSSNALAAMAAIISMGIVVIALTYRSERKFWFIAGDAVTLVLVYLFANYLLFTAR